MAKPCPDLCSLRSEEGAHIGGKRFFQESLKADYWASELFFFLWGQKPPISNAQESAWPQRYHFQLFTKYISQNFSHGFCGFSQLFSSIIRHRRFLLTATIQPLSFTRYVLPQVFPRVLNSDIHCARACLKPQPRLLEAFLRIMFTNIASNV